MTVCAMFGCKNRMHKGCGKHFFRFPMKDPERLARWIEVVQRDDWKPTVHSKVCSDHFTEKDYMIRPGAACPYLRTDAVPTPLFIQRKKKTKKKKFTKNPASDVPESNNAEGAVQVEAAPNESQDHQVEEALSESQDHQVEDMVIQDASTPSKEMEEPPKQTLESEPQSNEKATNAQETAEQEAEMERLQEKGLEPQTQGEQTAETQSQEQKEPPDPIMAAEPARWVVETRGEQPPSDRMAEIDVNITRQNERQVALILAELEDTHCEMRAAEARAAREAASNDNQSLDESMADCATSSDNQSSSNDNLPDYIPFDHAYTSLTISDKENNVPASIPAPAFTSTPAPFPIANPKIVKMRKKIKTIQKQVLRQSVKIKSLKQTLVELRRNNLSEKDPERVISEHCSGLALALFTTQLKNHRKYSSMQYCNLLKDFALRLYQASPKAYKFCRLFLSLPHPVSLRHWKVVMETNQEVVMQAEAEQGEDPQGDMSQEDILAGALEAVALESETSHEESLQNQELPETQTQ